MRKLIFLAGLISLGFGFGQPTPTFAQKNVVLFVVDDLGWADNDLSYSQSFATGRGDTSAFFETPNLRSMAQSGVTFTQAYASSPVCSPTRASLLLGQSPATHKISQWIGGSNEPGTNYVRNLPLASTTLAESFRDAGYQTAFAGKWHLGSASTPLDHGFGQNHGGGAQGTPPSWYANANGGFSWANGLPNDGAAFAGEYLTDRLTRDSVDFINNASSTEPFFLQLSHYGVHLPLSAPQDLVAKYVAKLNSGSYEKFNSLSVSERTAVATYAAMVDSVDRSLGAVQQALAARGIADNTMIVFTSDNGGLEAPEAGNFAPPGMNGPLNNGKGNLYEGGIRVPMLISGPGVVSGTNATPVIAHDLFPTMLNAAGVPLPNQPLDGVSLSGILAGQNAPDRGNSPVVVHYPHRSPQGGTPGGAIMIGNSKVIQSYNHGGLEFYDLANDLGETIDVERANLNRAEDLRVELHRFLDRTNAQVPTGFVFDTRHAGQSINISNSGFEFDTVADNTSGSPTNPELRNITGWNYVGGTQLSFGGLANPNVTSQPGPNFPGTDGDGINGAMDGQQIVYFGSFADTLGNNVTGQLIGIEQILDEMLLDNGEYTVRFAAGARSDQATFVDGLVRLLAGDTIIGEFETPHDANGLFREYQFIVDTADLDSSLFGQALRIQLFRDTDGGKVSYDNIRLFHAAAIPEPSAAMVLLMFPLVSMLKRRK